MKLLDVLDNVFISLKIPAYTAEFPETQPDLFAVFTPIEDQLTGHADNKPHYEITYIRISLFLSCDDGDFRGIISKITRQLIDAKITVSDRRFIRIEDNPPDKKYYHYTIDCEQMYSFKKK